MGKAATGMKVASHKFFKLTGLPHWTDFLKGWAALIAKERVMKLSKVVGEGGELSARDTTWAARIGLSKEKLADLHSKKLEGLIVDTPSGHLFNTDAWSAPERLKPSFDKIDATLAREHAATDERYGAMIAKERDKPIEIAMIGETAKDDRAAVKAAQDLKAIKLKNLAEAQRSEKAKATSRFEAQKMAIRRSQGDHARELWGAIHSEANRTVVTPGIGDLPMAADNPALRPLFMFKSYIYAAYSRMLTSGLQGPALWWAMELAGSAFISRQTLIMKMYLHGRGDEADKLMQEPVRFNAMAVTQDGTLGLAADVLNMAGKATGKQLRPEDLAATLAGEKRKTSGSVKNFNRVPDVASAIGGPVPEMANTLVTAVYALGKMGYNAMAHDKMNISDYEKRKVLKAVPGGEIGKFVYDTVKDNVP
jgi:hypothetical protein